VTRASLLVPEGWKPRPGIRVEIQATKDAPSPPLGVWRVIDRSPAGWWLQPADDRARAWAQHWPNALTQGCVEQPGRLLVPPGTAKRS
jgi:hypothetical protein